MSRADKVHLGLRAYARDHGLTFESVATLYALERTLDRLERTAYAGRFLLKGGLLLAVHDQRRVTRDIDLQAVDIDVDQGQLQALAEQIASAGGDDGLIYDTSALSVEPIREDASHEGLRVSFVAQLRASRIATKLDVSTGDPVHPCPATVVVPGILGPGDDVTVQAHPLELVIAEKTVTILERGTTSTRWRDYVDIVNLSRTQTFTAGPLADAVRRVAAYRDLQVEPLPRLLAGYGNIAQPKWAAWRRRYSLTERTHSLLDDQLAELLAFAGPLFTQELTEDHAWIPATKAWTTT